MDERSGSVFTATLDRGDVQSALQSDEPVDLLLDVERVAADGSGRETERVAIAWEPEDLERLLAQNSGEITLTFDEGELRQLLDADVDAHGMRERLAVVTVVAGLAAAGAGGASAMVAGGDQGGAAGTPAAVTHVAASEVSTGITAATAAGPTQAELQADAARGEALNAQYGLGTGPTAAEQAADTARGEALNAQYGLGAAATAAELRADTLRGEALNQQYSLGAARVAAPSEISTGITGSEPAAPSEISTGVVQQPAPTSPEITAGVTSEPTATTASGGSSWTAPSPEALAIAAGAILAITALGFAARSDRVRPRPI
jgi:hypothetical protein